MSPPNSDNALEVLLDVREKVAPELDEKLLRRCYEIQRTFQFDRDREIPLTTTRRLIEQFVGEEVGREESKQ